MATALSKDVTRESTVEHDGRLINITITADQKVRMKPKGMKTTGEVEIGILELYHQLCGCEGETTSEETKPSGAVSYSRKEPSKYQQPPNHMIESVLHDIRSQSAIAGLDMPTMAKFDQIIVNLISAYKS